MEVALSFAVVPFLTGRTVLAVGLLATFWAVQGVMHEGELSWKAVALGIGGGLVSSLLEAMAQRLREWVELISSTYRALEARVTSVLVSLIAMLWAAAVLGRFARQLVSEATAMAGLEPAHAVVLAVGLVAFFVATARASVSAAVAEVPLLDDGGVRTLFRRVELVWTFFGLGLVFLFPLFGVAVLLVTITALLWCWVLVRGISDGARRACDACARPVHLAASVCSGCRAERRPKQVGVLGRLQADEVVDVVAHRDALLGLKRCPHCAESLKLEGLGCETCRTPLWASTVERDGFLRRVDVRLLKWAPVFGALGLVPVVGLGVALVMYRLGPGAALAGFASWKGRLGARVVRALIVTALAVVQPVPVIGVVAVLGLIALQRHWGRTALLERGRAHS